MHRFLILTLALLGASPAAAQTGQRYLDQVPESGSATVRLETGLLDICVVAQTDTRWPVVPYLRTGPCVDAVPFVAEFIGQSRVRLMLKDSRNCATVARGVIAGTPRIDIQPCDRNAADQQFRLEESYGAKYIRTPSGACWWMEGPLGPGGELQARSCSAGRNFFRFALLDPAPVAAVPATPPAKQTRPLTLLPLVILPPAPPAATPPAEERVEPLAANPDNGVYRLQTAAGQCLEPQWETTQILGLVDCARATPIQIVRSERGGAGAFTFEYAAMGRCLAAAGFIRTAACGTSITQTFRFIRQNNASFQIETFERGRCLRVAPVSGVEVPVAHSLSCNSATDQQIWLVPAN